MTLKLLQFYTKTMGKSTQKLQCIELQFVDIEQSYYYSNGCSNNSKLLSQVQHFSN